MKTSIFNMTFTLPPMLGMTEVEKDMPTGSAVTGSPCSALPRVNC